MPSTKQPAGDRRRQAAKHAMSEGPKKITNKRLRAAEGDDYKSHAIGMSLALEHDYDPEGKDRQARQEKRMAPYSYSGKSDPKPNAVGWVRRDNTVTRGKL